MDDAWVLPALPVGAFVVLLLVSQYLPRKGDYVAILAMLAALVRRWRQGAFDPTPGRKVAERRERRALKVPHDRPAAPSTTAVLREHARLRGIPEDEYLEALSR